MSQDRLRQPGRHFYNLVSEVTLADYFHPSLLARVIAKVPPGSRGRDLNPMVR